jgi:hypothetical protein
MYRIELSPGEETVFRTIEELATGVRNGVISPRARIYHHASQKWLPIEFHPHYKKALEILASKTSPRAMAHPAPVGAGSAPLLAPILAPLPEPVHTPRPEPVLAPRPEPMHAPLTEPMHFPRPTLAPSSRPTPAPAPRATLTPMPWESAKAPAPAPMMKSPMLHLPQLVYPEVTPAEEPVAHASSARARAGARRPLQLALAAAVIAGCTFVVMRASARPEEPERFVAPRPESIRSARPAPAQVNPPKSSPPPRVSTSRATAPTLSRTATTGNAAMISAPGPAFAPATIGPKPTVAKPPVVAPAKSAAPDSTPAIEPAPAGVDLSLPALPQGDSLSTLPKSSADSAALGRILRAVGGTRPAQKPAP